MRNQFLRPALLAVVVLAGLGEFATLQRWRLHGWLQRRARAEPGIARGR